MTNDSNKHFKSDNEMKFDQFDEPKAMSVGWDLSNLPTISGSKTNNKDLHGTRQAGVDEIPDVPSHPDTTAEHHPDVDFDPFPEPRTVPTKWNVSALL